MRDAASRRRLRLKRLRLKGLFPEQRPRHLADRPELQQEIPDGRPQELLDLARAVSDHHRIQPEVAEIGFRRDLFPGELERAGQYFPQDLFDAVRRNTGAGGAWQRLGRLCVEASFHQPANFFLFSIDGRDGRDAGIFQQPLPGLQSKLRGERLHSRPRNISVQNGIVHPHAAILPVRPVDAKGPAGAQALLPHLLAQRGAGVHEAVCVAVVALARVAQTGRHGGEDREEVEALFARRMVQQDAPERLRGQDALHSLHGFSSGAAIQHHSCRVDHPVDWAELRAHPLDEGFDGTRLGRVGLEIEHPGPKRFQLPDLCPLFRREPGASREREPDSRGPGEPAGENQPQSSKPSRYQVDPVLPRSNPLAAANNCIRMEFLHDLNMTPGACVQDFGDSFILRKLGQDYTR